MFLLSFTYYPIATRYLTRHKTRTVSVIEAEAKSVDVSLVLSASSTCHSLFLAARQQDRHIFRYAHDIIDIVLAHDSFTNR